MADHKLKYAFKILLKYLFNTESLGALSIYWGRPLQHLTMLSVKKCFLMSSPNLQTCPDTTLSHSQPVITGSKSKEVTTSPTIPPPQEVVGSLLFSKLDKLELHLTGHNFQPCHQLCCLPPGMTNMLFCWNPLLIVWSCLHQRNVKIASIADLTFLFLMTYQSLEIPLCNEHFCMILLSPQFQFFPLPCDLAWHV